MATNKKRLRRRLAKRQLKKKEAASSANDTLTSAPLPAANAEAVVADDVVAIDPELVTVQEAAAEELEDVYDDELDDDLDEFVDDDELDDDLDDFVDDEDSYGTELQEAIDNLQDGEILVELQSGDLEDYATYGRENGFTIAEAIEQTSVEFANQLPGYPTGPIFCRARTSDGAVFGPVQVVYNVTFSIPAFEARDRVYKPETASD